MNLFVLFVFATAIVNGLPFTSDLSQPLNLAQVEAWPDTIKQIQAQTQDEISALENAKPDGKKKGGTFSLEAIEKDEDATKKEAEKVKEDASSISKHLRQWVTVPSGETSSHVEARLKDVAHVASMLMQAKGETIQLKNEEQHTLDDSLHIDSQQTLGEGIGNAQKFKTKATHNPAEPETKHVSNPTVAIAVEKAAKWEEGRQLAEEVLKLQKEAPTIKAGPSQTIRQERWDYARMVAREEKISVQKAVRMSQQIDAAGLQLNKWYNAHEKQGHRVGAYTTHALDTDLGEGREAVNPTQQAIEDAAVSSIKSIQNSAAKAIAEAAQAQSAPTKQAAGTVSDWHYQIGKPAAAAPADTSFARMGEAVKQVMSGIANTAAHEEHTQDRLMMGARSTVSSQELAYSYRKFTDDGP